MMKTKKRLAAFLTFIMMFSLLSLPQGIIANAADNTTRADYLIYFDADNGKLYKETGDFITSNASSWTPAASEEYTDDSISCSGNRLILHDFYIFPKTGSTGIVIKGDAVIELYGKNEIAYVSGSGFPPASSSNCGIFAYDNLTITGIGCLEANAGNTAIYASKNLTTPDATLIASGGYKGITVNGDFTINSGSVTGQTTLYYGHNNPNGHRSAEWGIYTSGALQINGGTVIGDVTDRKSVV